tara:strand:- start:233 stop:460 length:228 start_codon:yes stop_codon:yes gene_type:complete
MIQYIIIFEYATASVVIESIEFARYKDFASFDFETYVLDNYGNNTSYLCCEKVQLSTKTTMCKDINLKKYLFADK